VLRRSLTILVIAVLVLAIAAAASAALVRVRVEGKTQTIFGSSQPRAQAATALDALEAASIGGEFYYHVQQTQFGPYIDQVGRYPAAGSGGWVFKVNGTSPPVGADKVALKDGDVVLWYWATFSDKGGPSTLELSRQKGGCYRAIARDDAGVASAPVGAALRVDGLRVSMQGAGQAMMACPGPHRSLVRAVAPGAVRSNALP
jgi:Domain of unknown function (DUF4430)